MKPPAGIIARVMAVAIIGVGDQVIGLPNDIPFYQALGHKDGIGDLQGAQF
jgi:hypothetical protein